MISQEALGNKIKSLREGAKMSQDEFGQKTGLSRVAVSQIELGQRGVGFLELAKIADVFGLRTDSFLMDEELSDVGQEEMETSASVFDAGKLRNVLLYILEKCAGKPNVGETVLYKLLYFIDFDFFEMNKKSVTGLDYIHLQFGPAPAAKQYLPVIENMKERNELKIISQDYFGMKMKRYINLITHDIESLNSRETKTIDDVINSLSNLSATQIKEYVHGDAPWRLTQDKKIIPYPLAFERAAPYSKVDDELREFMQMGAIDVLKELGPISKEEYDYYEKL